MHYHQSLVAPNLYKLPMRVVGQCNCNTHSSSHISAPNASFLVAPNVDHVTKVMAPSMSDYWRTPHHTPVHTTHGETDTVNHNIETNWFWSPSKEFIEMFSFGFALQTLQGFQRENIKLILWSVRSNAEDNSGFLHRLHFLPFGFDSFLSLPLLCLSPGLKQAQRNLEKVKWKKSLLSISPGKGKVKRK